MIDGRSGVQSLNYQHSETKSNLSRLSNKPHSKGDYLFRYIAKTEKETSIEVTLLLFASSCEQREPTVGAPTEARIIVDC